MLYITNTVKNNNLVLYSLGVTNRVLFSPKYYLYKWSNSKKKFPIPKQLSCLNITIPTSFTFFFVDVVDVAEYVIFNTTTSLMKMV